MRVGGPKGGAPVLKGHLFPAGPWKSNKKETNSVGGDRVTGEGERRRDREGAKFSKKNIKVFDK